MSLSVVIPGKPQPKERPRSGAGGRFYTPESTRKYQRHVKACLRAALLAAPRWPMDGRYRVVIEAHFPNRHARDLDNVAKAVLDGANGFAWNDDAQVDELVVRRHLDRDNPRVEMRVEVEL